MSTRFVDESRAFTPDELALLKEAFDRLSRDWGLQHASDRAELAERLFEVARGALFADASALMARVPPLRPHDGRPAQPGG